MDLFIKNTLWDYWKRGDDEIVLTNGKVSDLKEEYPYEDDVLTKDIIRFKTYKEYKDDWIFEWNKDMSWVHEKPWMDNEAWKEPTHVKHYYEPFSFKSGHSEWPTYSWKYDGYCNRRNLPGTFRDNASYHTNEEEEQDDEDRCKLLGNPHQEPPVFEIRRFKMIKCSFGPVENYVAIKECEYNDLTRTKDDACHAYQ
ncbi:hypothetical protein Tco_0710209 [Tanacetum coccineum]